MVEKIITKTHIDDWNGEFEKNGMDAFGERKSIQLYGFGSVDQLKRYLVLSFGKYPFNMHVINSKNLIYEVIRL